MRNAVNLSGQAQRWARAAVRWSAALLLASGCRPPDVCREGQVATPVHAQRDAKAGYHLRAHAHNDYEHARPLLDALDNRFYSVEADIYWGDGKLTVSHVPWESKGTLKELYLDPLQAKVDAQGSVYGDGVPFVLWIDLKDGSKDLVTTLHDLLEQYPMLTRFSDSGVTPGPVTAVLTGDAGGKTDFVTRFPERRAIRDSNDYTPNDPPADNAWRYYALKWGDYLSASSSGELDATQQGRLACITENAHAAGRQVRFYDVPEHATTWQAQLDANVDFLSTDDLPGMNSFLESAP